MVMNYKGRDVFIIAHRGGSSSFENSISSFLKAQEMGVDAVECDIHTTKDGKLVISHDPDLVRIANIDKKIAEMDYDEISGIRLPNGERIPALEELLEIMNIPVVIELKSRETVFALLSLFSRRKDFINKCVVISFYHDAVRIMKREIPDLMCGILFAGFPVDPVSMARDSGCNMISLYYEGLDGEYVEKCHKGGIMLTVWAPNDEKAIRDSLDAGVDGIGSDRPDLVLKIIENSHML